MLAMLAAMPGGSASAVVGGTHGGGEVDGGSRQCYDSIPRRMRTTARRQQLCAMRERAEASPRSLRLAVIRSYDACADDGVSLSDCSEE